MADTDPLAGLLSTWTSASLPGRAELVNPVVMGLDDIKPWIYWDECPSCAGLVLRHGYGASRDCRVCYPDVETSCMALKKPEESSPGLNALSPLQSAGDVLGAFPCLVEWLSCSKWDDGTQRQLSTFKLGMEDGKWKLTFLDTDGGRVLYLSSPLLEEVMLSLEVALQTGKGDWQKDRWAAKRRK